MEGNGRILGPFRSQEPGKVIHGVLPNFYEDTEKSTDISNKECIWSGWGFERALNNRQIRIRILGESEGPWRI